MATRQDFKDEMGASYYRPDAAIALIKGESAEPKAPKSEKAKSFLEKAKQWKRILDTVAQSATEKKEARAKYEEFLRKAAEADAEDND